jgi:tRNA(His) guanylyltransferase
MKFNELDKKMRIFETTSDQYVLPGIYIVARLDGRSFTHLTRDVHHFEAPFDARFRDPMVATTEHLMQCGFHVIYGYTQSDEISLLFHRDEDLFGRKLRKYVSLLAGEASAKFSLQLGSLASFDCRISQLPLVEYVCDYFQWRAEDAHRNSLNGHCYWMLRKQDHSAKEAMARLYRMSVAEKNELLFRGGINYNDLPLWQKRGTGLFWEIYPKERQNPLTGQSITAKRRRIKVELELPAKDHYADFILGMIRGFPSECDGPED